jgi:hypothetical protein
MKTMVEEIRTLTDLALNAQLHEATGNCWHKVLYYTHNCCSKCGLNDANYADRLPNYCNDFTAVIKAERFVIEQCGHLLYSTALRSVLFDYQQDALTLISHAVTMTARARAEACLLALQQHAFENNRAVDKIPPQVKNTVVSFGD